MSRDPFYEEILAGLNGLSDSDRTLFQDCMTDLLRDTFPSLVPVRGGKDSGMDGAIADGEGEPYPLVVTTAEDVERNLTRSLDSFLKRKRPRRKVVLATSQALTPELQHKLKDVAQEKGFTLVGLIEQSGIADRLRENGYWRERLLGLTGEPSTLSVVPASRRPLLDVSTIATTWEWEKAKVIDALGVGEVQVRRFEPHTRDDIVAVSRRSGVQESPHMMPSVVHQAANKPGQATTSVTLWLQREQEY